MSERDTHFAGFAKLLWREIAKTSFDRPGWSEYPQLERILQQIIAQHTYDLLFHCFKQYPLTDEEAHRHIIRNCPDLTELPSSQERK